MAEINKEIIRDLSTPELVDRIDEEKTLLRKKKFAHAVSPIENPNEIKILRRNVARLITELRRRQLTNKV